MRSKLRKSKYYLVDLETKVVLAERAFDGFFKAIDAIGKMGAHYRIGQYTAERGQHLLEHEGHPWIIPAAREA